MEICKVYGYICVALLMLAASVSAETRVEASFTQNPVGINQNTVFECQVWDLTPDQQVGINGRTVFVRNGQLIASAPDNIFLDVFPSQPDGSTLYHLTIEGVAMEDAGPYSCVVLTVVDTVMAVATKSSTLEVLDIYLPPDGYPKCSLLENRLSYYAGEEITLSCYSSDGKPSITLLWTRADIPLSKNQTLSQEGDLLFKNMTTVLEETDNGVVFKCIIVSLEFPSNGRECTIGPIAVWPPKMTTSAVSYNTTDNFDMRTIAGLTLPVFVMVVVGVGLFVLILLILFVVFCVRAYNCVCIVHKKSYSMHGLKNEDHMQEGTLRVDMQYTPTRPAPVAPPPSYIESQQDTEAVQQRYTPNKEAQSNAAKRLSAVESALLLAVSKSTMRKQTSIHDDNGGEIIYANTSRPSSMIELQPIKDDEEDHDDSDSGFVNPAFADNELPYTDEVTRPSSMSVGSAQSRPTSQSEIIYHNTAELPINTDPEEEVDQPKFVTQDSDHPEYARVDKSRSRSSTMDSVKRGTVEPEAVTTLDDSIMYHNTADLAINNTTPTIPSSPPPIPANPPSPVTAKKPQYRRQISSVSAGGLEKPSFKPPPPPTPTSPRANSSLYSDTEIGEGTEAEKDDKPKIAPKPALPKKPTYKI